MHAGAAIDRRHKGSRVGVRTRACDCARMETAAPSLRSRVDAGRLRSSPATLLLDDFVCCARHARRASINEGHPSLRVQASSRRRTRGRSPRRFSRTWPVQRSPCLPHADILPTGSKREHPTNGRATHTRAVRLGSQISPRVRNEWPRAFESNFDELCASTAPGTTHGQFRPTVHMNVYARASHLATIQGREARRCRSLRTTPSRSRGTSYPFRVATFSRGPPSQPQPRPRRRSDRCAHELAVPSRAIAGMSRGPFSSTRRTPRPPPRLDPPQSAT
ncbi:hypothetical protein C8Q79DRAFT_14633 [Trametes meyenii]|nr:hypothetical protein C8Q79DRAFT_14633 [Trametes meyenii]